METRPQLIISSLVFETNKLLQILSQFGDRKGFQSKMVLKSVSTIFLIQLFFIFCLTVYSAKTSEKLHELTK